MSINRVYYFMTDNLLNDIILVSREHGNKIKGAASRIRKHAYLQDLS